MNPDQDRDALGRFTKAASTGLPKTGAEWGWAGVGAVCGGCVFWAIYSFFGWCS